MPRSAAIDMFSIIGLKVVIDVSLLFCLLLMLPMKQILFYLDLANQSQSLHPTHPPYSRSRQQ